MGGGGVVGLGENIAIAMYWLTTLHPFSWKSLNSIKDPPHVFLCQSLSPNIYIHPECFLTGFWSGEDLLDRGPVWTSEEFGAWTILDITSINTF